MSKLFLALLLVPVLCLGQTFTIPISSPLNGTGITIGMAVTPLDGTGTPITSMTQGWPANTILQTSTAFVFPSTTSVYTISGFELEVNPKGTGWTPKRSALLDTTFPAQTIQPGTSVQAVVTFPLVGSGSVVVTLVTPPPPPIVPPTTTASAPGSCTAPSSVSGCPTPLTQLIDSTGASWTVLNGRTLMNGKDTNNPYVVLYLYINGPADLRSHNSNGTYACWLVATQKWGC